MAKYIAIFDQDGDQFGAYFPDAPGCTAMGATMEEVMDNAFEALAEWAAAERAVGRKVPPPRSHLQLLQSRKYGLGHGSMIARITLLIETGTLARANISLDAGLLADIDEAASRAGLTRSSFLASAAREKIRASD